MNQSELAVKLCSWCQARENLQPLPSAGKCATASRVKQWKYETSVRRPIHI